MRWRAARNEADGIRAEMSPAEQKAVWHAESAVLVLPQLAPASGLSRLALACSPRLGAAIEPFRAPRGCYRFTAGFDPRGLAPCVFMLPKRIHATLEVFFLFRGASFSFVFSAWVFFSPAFSFSLFLISAFLLSWYTRGWR